MTHGESRRAAVANRHVPKPGHFVAIRPGVQRFGQNGSLPRIASGQIVSPGRKRLAAHELLPRLLGPATPVVHDVYMRHERRHVVGRRDHPHDPHVGPLGQSPEKPLERLPRSRVEPDERALDKEHAGRGQQHLGDLEPAQLAARKQHDPLAEQAVHVQHREQLVSPPRIAGRTPERLRRQRRLLAVGRVPPLLVIIAAIGRAVRIAERNMAYVIASLAAGFAEIVAQFAPLQIQQARQRLDQHGFPAAVRSDDRQMLVGVQREVDRLAEAPALVPDHASPQGDHGVSSIIFHIGSRSGQDSPYPCAKIAIAEQNTVLPARIPT